MSQPVLRRLRVFVTDFALVMLDAGQTRRCGDRVTPELF